MWRKPTRRRVLPQLVFWLLGLTVLTALKDIASSFAAGCGTAQFTGNLTTAAVGISPRSMVSGDFNKDGKNDLAVANYGSSLGSSDGAISILLNNGMGGFLPATNISAGINPRSIVSADFNKDTKLDLAVVNNVSGSCCISSFVTILLGDGSGGFTVFGSPQAVGNDSSALTTGDYNKDGNPDLAATILATSGGVSVLLGNGTGAFASAQAFTVGGNPRTIATADFNGDNKPDIVTGNLFGPNVGVLLGDGSGGFGSVINSSTGAATIRSIDVGDFNQDSKIDVVAATSFNSVAVVLGNGDGTFAAPTQFLVGSSPESVLAQDLNADGKVDLVTANIGTGNASVLLGDGAGSFGSVANYSVGGGPIFVESSDLNGDSKLDLAFANAASNTISILSGDGLGGFSGARDFGVGSIPLAVAGGDFNGDSNPDLVLPNAGQNSVSVLLGDGNGVFGADVKYLAGLSPRDVTVADFNGDGRLDIGVANGTCCQTDSVSILLGNGTGGFGPPTTFTAGTDAVAIVSADFNKDGNIDVAVANNEDSTVSVLMGAGNGSFAAPVNISLAFPSDVAAGDINGDGNVDLIGASGAAYVLLGDGAGGFSVGAPIVLPGAVISVVVGDVNGDGLADLATANNSDTVSLLVGNGSGGFRAPATFAVTSPNSLALADLNGDGKTDLAASSGSNDVVILLGDGTGAFGPPATFTAGSTPGGILPIDLNRDGRVDLAVADNSDFLSVLMNTCPATPFVPPAISISDVTLAEGNSGQTNASFTVSLSGVNDQTVTVSYFSSNQSATGGIDYQTVSGHVTFLPGVTTQTINVPINGDAAVESDETFRVFLSQSLNAAIAKGNGTGKILDDDGAATVALSASTYSVSENAANLSVTILRSGVMASAITVDYATSDTAGSNCDIVGGIASSRCDYLNTIGTLHFAANEFSKTILIPIENDSYAEGNEIFTFTLSNPIGAAVSATASATITISDDETSNGPNPIDVSSFFVHQHYVDFLNREPDTGGLNFWIDQIENCTPKPQCTEVRRINVSAAFYLSIEFQETGYLVYRFYKSAYGNLSGTPVPLRLIEFLPDTQQIGKDVVIGQPGAEQQLEANKVAYALDFVSRERFASAHPTTLTPAQFVDALFANGAVTPSATDRNAAVNEFDGAGNTGDLAARARALRRIAENSTLNRQETSKAFVLMQYFGYLRRNPDDAPEPGLNFDGYNFWLGKLNEFNGNFVNAEMVKAFIVSGEYRYRFGP